MSDKNLTKNSDDKNNEESKKDEQNIQKEKRMIPDVEKIDRITLPEMRIDFNTDQGLTDQ